MKADLRASESVTDLWKDGKEKRGKELKDDGNMEAGRTETVRYLTS